MRQRGLMPLMMHGAADDDPAVNGLRLGGLGRGAVDEINDLAVSAQALGDERGHVARVAFGRAIHHKDRLH